MTYIYEEYKNPDLSNEEKDQWIKDYGGYNDLPPNWKPISLAKFAQHPFFTYGFEKTEHRQAIIEKEGPYENIKLFFLYDGTGIGMVADYWKKKVKFFTFAKCEHKFTELSQLQARKEGHSHFGNCWHVYKCKKCGFVESHDSSD